MKSHEILKRCMGSVGVKSISADMNLSASLLYKWCHPKDHPDSPGADNPLDRLQRIVELTGDHGPVKWLCEQNNDYFIENSALESQSDIPLINVTRGILKEFSHCSTPCRRVSRTTGKSWRTKRRKYVPPRRC